MQQKLQKVEALVHFEVFANTQGDFSKLFIAVTLFVFSISDRKQNARSHLTPPSNPAFHALSHGSLGFALHDSFFNHFLNRQNSLTANQIL